MAEEVSMTSQGAGNNLAVSPELGTGLDPAESLPKYTRRCVTDRTSLRGLSGGPGPCVQENSEHSMA